jgi:hypothetical protein
MSCGTAARRASRQAGAGAESERRGERRQVRRGVGPQRHQRGRRRQGQAHGPQPCVTGEQVRQQRDDREESETDRHQPPSDPADRGGERDVGAQDVGRRFHTARGLHRGDHVLNRLERTGKMTGETIGQQTEGLARRRTVVARDAHPDGRAPRVRAVAHEAAAAARMAGTRGETCVTPGTARNIGLAGERARVTQLHRPGDARRHPWRPHFSSPSPRWRPPFYHSLARRHSAAAVSHGPGLSGDGGGARRHPQASIGLRATAAERLHGSLSSSLKRFSLCAQRSAIS